MSSAEALTGLLFCLLALVGLWWGQNQVRINRMSRQVDQHRRAREQRALQQAEEGGASARYMGTALLADKELDLRGPRRIWRRLFGVRGRGEVETDRILATVCIEVAARLRAGAPAEKAWEDTWWRLMGEAPVLGSSGIPVTLEQMENSSAQVIAVANRFSAATGAPLADILEQTGKSISDLERAQAAQRVAFAGPSMSAKVLSVLPALGLLGGELMGADPIGWFLSGIPQGALGLVGLTLAFTGHAVSKRMIARASKVGLEQQMAPTLCDLVQAGLRGGGAIPTVLDALGVALQDEEYSRVAGELTLGATWAEAWHPAPYGSSLLRVAVQPAWEEGVAPGSLLRQLADQARRRSLSDAKEAAEQLGVKLALPLGLLLLPSFVILGLVPLFFSLVGSQLLAPFGVG